VKKFGYLFGANVRDKNKLATADNGPDTGASFSDVFLAISLGFQIAAVVF
jgi:hypothetical protein